MTEKTFNYGLIYNMCGKTSSRERCRNQQIVSGVAIGLLASGSIYLAILHGKGSIKKVLCGKNKISEKIRNFMKS